MDTTGILLVVAGIAVASLAASLIIIALGFVGYVYKEQRGQRNAIERLVQASSTTDPALLHRISEERIRALAEEQATDIQPAIGQEPVDTGGEPISMP